MNIGKEEKRGTQRIYARGNRKRDAREKENKRRKTKQTQQETRNK